MTRKHPFHLTLPVLLGQAALAALHLASPVPLSQEATPALPARRDQRCPLYLAISIKHSRKLTLVLLDESGSPQPKSNSHPSRKTRPEMPPPPSESHESQPETPVPPDESDSRSSRRTQPETEDIPVDDKRLGSKRRIVSKAFKSVGRSVGRSVGKKISQQFKKWRKDKVVLTESIQDRQPTTERGSQSRAAERGNQSRASMRSSGTDLTVLRRPPASIRSTGTALTVLRRSLMAARSPSRLVS